MKYGTPLPAWFTLGMKMRVLIGERGRCSLYKGESD